VCGAALGSVDFSLKPGPAQAPAAAGAPAAVGGAATPAAGAPPAPPAAAIACPHPDCGQPNPAGRDRCVYCNRPLRAPAPSAAAAGARPLPSALRRDWRVLDALPAAGSDADLLRVGRPAAGALRPYRIGAFECATAAELAPALVRHWEAATRDLARGQVVRWLEQDLNDHNLARAWRDIADERGGSDDMRLLRFALAAAPDLPPVWRGEPVSAEALQDAARRAATDDDAALRWLDSIASEDVLVRFAAAGHRDLADFDRRWRDGWTRFVERWKRAQAAEEAWRKAPRAVAGAASPRVAHFDDLAFSAPMWLSPPPRARVNGALLLALSDADTVGALQREVIAGQAEVAGFCPWFDALCAEVAGDPVGTLVAQQMLPHARDDAAMERNRQGSTQAARDRIVDEARADLRFALRDLLRQLDSGGDPDAEATAKLFESLAVFQEACQKLLALGYADPEFQALRLGVEKLSVHTLIAQRALARSEAVQRVNAIFMRPERLGIAAVTVVAALALWAPALMLALAAVGVGALGYRWHLARQAGEAARTPLRLLALHGKAMLRAPAPNEPPPAGG